MSDPIREAAMAHGTKMAGEMIRRGDDKVILAKPHGLAGTMAASFDSGARWQVAQTGPHWPLSTDGKAVQTPMGVTAVAHVEALPDLVEALRAVVRFGDSLPLDVLVGVQDVLAKIEQPA